MTPVADFDRSSPDSAVSLALVLLTQVGMNDRVTFADSGSTDLLENRQRFRIKSNDLLSLPWPYGK